MKNHELLAMIGEVNEDYVLEAENNAAKPRFPWKALVGCAACAALVLCAYPVWRAARPHNAMADAQDTECPLHAYTVVEGGSLTTQGDMKAPAGGGERCDPGPDLAPAEAYMGEDAGQEGIDGACYNAPSQDAPADEEAANQYAGLLQGMSLREGRWSSYPEWYAGAWIDHGGGPDTPAWLAVAIVDSFRTPELEAQIRDWCGGTGEIVFTGAKYSYSHLDSLMDPVGQALDGAGLACGIGVDVEGNCLGLDIYSDDAVPDQILAELARLDPDGDAIRVRVFAGQTINTDLVKGPAPDIAEEPAVEPEPVPGGAQEDQPAAEPSIGADGQDIPAETAQAAAAGAE